MRKAHQRQLLEMARMLQEAHGEVARLLAAGDGAAAVALLADCQAGALQLGGFIEELAGEGTKTVGLLEGYCELLYQAGGQVQAAAPQGGTAAGKSAALAAEAQALVAPLQKQMLEVEGGIRAELKPDELLILFLPYKASMWDSMQSLWRAAEADPACTALVAPIPYYDRLPGGGLGAMHCEGALYPAGVPVVDWQGLDIAELHPEVIVVQNAYDDQNYITSVHPDFYNRKLRELTDLLVYIPYFVNARDSVEDYLTAGAGMRYAHRVVVQSEAIREIYVRAMREAEEATGCQGQFGEVAERVLALGSPKFDAAITMRREDFEYPAAWQDKVRSPGSGRKKVVLYNTGISALLAGDEAVLRKLEDTFSYFRNREDVVLLWRPHPLNAAALKSMRPMQAAGYHALVAAYRREGWGIYDDSPDFHMAMAFSDAYYGDGSSLVPLYQFSGKPVMEQNFYLGWRAGQEGGPAFQGAYDDGTHLWYAAIQFNGLFRVEKATRQVQFMGRFPGEKPDGWCLYGSVVEKGGKLYFGPFSAREIAVYDLAGGTFSKIPLAPPRKSAKAPYVAEAKLVAAGSYKKWVFFTPVYYPALVRCDTETGELAYFDDWLEEVDALYGGAADALFGWPLWMDETHLALASCCSSAVIVFDVAGGTFQLLAMLSAGGQDMAFDGRDYWFTPRLPGPVLRWNPKTGVTTKYEEYPEGFQPGSVPFTRIHYASGFLWLLPCAANMALKLDPATGVMEIVEAFQPECDYPGLSALGTFARYLQAEQTGGVFTVQTGLTNHIIEYDPATGARREGPVEFAPEEREKWLALARESYEIDPARCAAPEDCVYRELPLRGLDVFVEELLHPADEARAKALAEKQAALRRAGIAGGDGKAGEAIYRTLKGEVLG